MNISSLLHKVLNYLTERNDGIFTFDVKKQENILNKFPEPLDEIQRSYYQYLCQMKIIKNSVVRIVMNIASFPAFIFYLFKPTDKVERTTSGTVFFSDGKPINVIPNSLKLACNEIIDIKEKKESIDNDVRKMIMEIWKRYPFAYYFELKCLIKLRYYCHAIKSFEPNSIITCNEYSFTSSILTKYCERKHIRHINVMHGEKLFYIRDSFFKFHVCYVWDSYYIELFKHLRAEETQFIVEEPEALVFSANIEDKEKSIDYTYYLGAEKGDILETIVYLLRKLSDSGASVSIRPHPRYTSIEGLKRIANGIEIEDNNFTIEESLMRTKKAVSLYSSVLNQAFHNKIPIAIDDVSDKQKFEILKSLGYIIFSKEHSLLSECLKFKNK